MKKWILVNFSNGWKVSLSSIKIYDTYEDMWTYFEYIPYTYTTYSGMPMLGSLQNKEVIS